MVLSACKRCSKNPTCRRKATSLTVYQQDRPVFKKPQSAPSCHVIPPHGDWTSWQPLKQSRICAHLQDGISCRRLERSISSEKHCSLPLVLMHFLQQLPPAALPSWDTAALPLLPLHHLPSLFRWSAPSRLLSSSTFLLSSHQASAFSNPNAELSTPIGAPLQRACYSLEQSRAAWCGRTLAESLLCSAHSHSCTVAVLVQDRDEQLLARNLLLHHSPL